MPTIPLLLTLALGLSGVAPPEPADLVIMDARIWSGDRTGFARFAAIRDGRFVYVGEHDDRYFGPHTTRVRADGRVVLPGLIDAHVHMLGGGSNLSQLQLRTSVDKADFISRVADWSSSLPQDTWILGGRWSTESWESPEQPTKDWVDAVSGGHPLYLPRMDGHSALVNSKALDLAGIDRSGPPDPEGGVIDRDPTTGEPTGILRESAMALVARLVPAVSGDERLAALRLAMNHALAHGVTAVSDIPGIGDLDLYERLAASGDMPMRLFLYPTAADWNAAASSARRFRGRPGWVEVNGLKTYLDGSLGSRTAFMCAPFANNEPGREGWRGLLREGVGDGQLEQKLAAARDAGLQPIAHAIGDCANRLLLDTTAAIYDDPAAARCRSEHTQHLRAEDIPRFAEIGVIASMQPFHKADDGRYAEDYIGPERARTSYAYKSLLDAGAVLAFGSDWPVVTINPFLGIEAAVTGRTLDGRHWQTQENLTVTEALRCYTMHAAYAVFREHELGRIAPGYRADFLIMNRSPFDADVDWSELRPDAVFVEGACASGDPVAPAR